MSTEQGLWTLRERLARLDKHLAKLYRYSAGLNKKIERLVRERVKLVERIEKEERRVGQRDPPETARAGATRP